MTNKRSNKKNFENEILEGLAEYARKKKEEKKDSGSTINLLGEVESSPWTGEVAQSYLQKWDQAALEADPLIRIRGVINQFLFELRNRTIVRFDSERFASTYENAYPGIFMRCTPTGNGKKNTLQFTVTSVVTLKDGIMWRTTDKRVVYQQELELSHADVNALAALAHSDLSLLQKSADEERTHYFRGTTTQWIHEIEGFIQDLRGEGPSGFHGRVIFGCINDSTQKFVAKFETLWKREISKRLDWGYMVSARYERTLHYENEEFWIYVSARVKVRAGTTSGFRYYSIGPVKEVVDIAGVPLSTLAVYASRPAQQVLGINTGRGWPRV